MTDRTPPAAAQAPRPHDPAALDGDIVALLQRAATVAGERALDLVERAPDECAAVLLAVHPRALDRVRALLADPAARTASRDVVARAPAAAPPAAAEVRRAAARTAEALAAEAARRPGGAAILASASVECAAIVFGVHPDLVLAARALLRGRAGGPAPAGEEER